MRLSGCCSQVPGRTGGSYKEFLFFFFGEKSLSYLDELIINEQFTVHRNMHRVGENEKNDVFAAGFLRGLEKKKM